MMNTKNDLSESTRRKVCEALSPRLADVIDLHYQAKQAHWNVKGVQFKSLHELFDEVSAAAEKYVDLFAERIVQLGGVAVGTIRAASQTSSLPEYPLDLLQASDHIDTLGDRLRVVAKSCRENIERCEADGDMVTADIFTEAVTEFDKLTWMLEASFPESDAFTKGKVADKQRGSNTQVERLSH